jgi:hypothetical protein
VLDMVFGEEYCRKRKENADENFNLIRRMALNFIRSYKGDKHSLRRRRLSSGWNADYTQKIFSLSSPKSSISVLCSQPLAT